MRRIQSGRRLVRGGKPTIDDTPQALRAAVAACRLCREAPFKTPLPHEPRPIFRLSGSARLVIASQAPGMRAHKSGVPFMDPSGARLRDWLDLDEASFYDESRLMILPMGFCFPGQDRSGGDLPPRRECRLEWHDRVFESLPQVETILAIGLHAVRYHAGRLTPDAPVTGLTAAVMDWRRYFERSPPRLLPLPHPSWRNTGWLKRHPWFAAELLPVLRAEVRRLMVLPPADATDIRSARKRKIAKTRNQGDLAP